MKTVALVGFAENTRDFAPYDDPDVKIWAMNESYHFDFMKRYDLLFQIHPRVDFTRKNNFNDSKHWEWLQCKKEERDTSIPIIMQKAYEDVPGSIEFPLEDIKAQHPAPFVVTSTFGYMMAYAIYVEKVERILIYGFDMTNETEYRYQRPNAEYWIGFARGLGIEVVVHEKSSLTRGPLYAYDFSRLITDTHLKVLLEKQTELAAEEEVKFKRTEKKFHDLEEALSDDSPAAVKEAFDKVSKKLSNEVAFANIQLGMKQELEQLLHIVQKQHEGEDETDTALIGELDFNGFLNRQHLQFRLENIESAIETMAGNRQAKIGYKQCLLDIQELGMLDERLLPELKKVQESIAKATGVLNTVVGRKGVVKFLMTMIDMQYEDETGDITGKIREALEERYGETKKEAK